MSTKDYCLSFKEKHQNVANVNGTSFNNDNQFNNLDLNQSNKCSNINFVQSKSISNNLARNVKVLFDMSDQFSGNNISDSKNSWKKDNLIFKPIQHSSIQNFNEISEKTLKEENGTSAAKSTLSLHITAYENATLYSEGSEVIEKSAKKNGGKMFAEKLLSSLSSSTTFFEIPRQQENLASTNTPEIMQFKASQKLLNLNENSAPMASDRNLIVEIQHGEGFIKISTTNIEENTVKHEKLPCLVYVDEGRQLFARIQQTVNLKNVKAIAFMLMEPENVKFQQVSNLRQKCLEFCKNHGIFCFLTSAVFSNICAAISQSKIVPKEGENILVCCGIGVGARGCVCVPLIREKNYYRITKIEETVFVTDVLETFKPDKSIILENSYMDESDMAFAFRYCLNEKNYSFIDVKQDENESYLTAATVDKILHLMDDQNIYPNDVAIPCEDIFDVCIDGKSIFKVLEYQTLPFQHSVIIDIDGAKKITLFQTPPDLFRRTPRFLFQQIQNDPQLIQEIDLSTVNSKNAKVILKIDINSFPDLKVEPIEDGKNELNEIMKKLSVVE